MAKRNKPPPRSSAICGFDVDQLEVGLRALDDGSGDVTAFWDKNISAFRQTLLAAVEETSDALLSSSIPLSWRVQLESQLEALVQYVALADRYIARRLVSFEPAAPGLPLADGPARWRTRGAGRLCAVQ